jgi:hypothetical protein
MDMLKALEHSTKNSNTVPLEDRHVQHLNKTRNSFLKEFASKTVVAVALPPIVCKERYQYMHVYIEAGEVVYRTARPVGYPRSAAMLLMGDRRENSRVGIKEALEFAEKHWGGQLYDTAPNSATRSNGQWTFQWGSDKTYNTALKCEVNELAWGFK